jgi:hypothetical protein
VFCRRRLVELGHIPFSAGLSLFFQRSIRDLAVEVFFMRALYLKRRAAN